MRLNEIFCPGCGSRICDFVAYCPVCGFDIKTYRSKSREQQLEAYFKEMYSHAPKSEDGFAVRDKAPHAANGNAWNASIYPEQNSGVNGKQGRKPLSRKSRTALIISLSAAVVCIAAALIIPNAIKSSRTDDVPAEYTSDTSSVTKPAENVSVSPGIIRYTGADRISCTMTADTDSHIVAVVRSYNGGYLETGFVNIEYGTGEYTGVPNFEIIGYAECDDSVSMRSINTSYKYVTYGEGSLYDCNIVFKIDFPSRVNGLFVYDVEFSDNRSALRNRAVSVQDGLCIAQVNCSDIADDGQFKATLVPKGFVYCEGEIHDTQYIEPREVGFISNDYYSITKVEMYVDLSGYADIPPDSIVLYNYNETPSSEVFIRKCSWAYAYIPTNVYVEFSDIFYGVDVECPAYNVEYFGFIPLKANREA